MTTTSTERELMTNPAKFDLCVVDATPAGIAAAVRAARAGHHVLLTQHTGHIGGMCTNGLGQWDAKSDHRKTRLACWLQPASWTAMNAKP